MTSTLNLIIEVVVAVAVLIGLPVAGRFLRWRTEDGASDHMAHRSGVALTCSLAICFVATLYVQVSGQSGGVFADAGLERRLALPATYLIFLLVLIKPGPAGRRVPKLPWWWWLLLGSLVASTISNIVAPVQDQNLNDYAQSALFIVGFLVTLAVGVNSATWSATQQRRLLALLILFAALAIALDADIGPFVALVIPTGFLLVEYAIRHPGRRGVAVAIAGLAMVAIPLIRTQQSVDPSDATISQAVVCVGVLAIVHAPRLTRIPIVVLGAIGALVFFARSQLLQLMLGNGSGTNDVTLAHRAYEASQVYTLISETTASRLFGAGPAATVNLLNSPDALTLAASGRNLLAVDDVHFLHAWLLLKLGAVGLSAVLAIVAVLGIAILRTLSRRTPTILQVGAILFALSGVSTALPAATYLFSNPLAGLGIGLVVAGGGILRGRNASTESRGQGGVHDETALIPSSAPE